MASGGIGNTVMFDASSVVGDTVALTGTTFDVDACAPKDVMVWGGTGFSFNVTDPNYQVAGINVQYSLDGGGWITATAGGRFVVTRAAGEAGDEEEAPILFRLANVAPGTHTLDFRVILETLTPPGITGVAELRLQRSLITIDQGPGLRCC